MGYPAPLAIPPLSLFDLTPRTSTADGSILKSPQADLWARKGKQDQECTFCCHRNCDNGQRSCGWWVHSEKHSRHHYADEFGSKRTGLNSACRRFCFGSALLFFVGIQVGATAEIDKRNPLIGTWLSVKYVDTPEYSEPIFAFGKEPVGYFIFTPGGHVAFSIMRNPPDIENPTSDPDPDACIPGWYCAYFGTYTVDVKSRGWVTHVLSANAPGFLNTDQPRHFTMNGNTLVVSETYLSGGKRIKAERVFVREEVPSSRPLHPGSK